MKSKKKRPLNSTQRVSSVCYSLLGFFNILVPHVPYLYICYVNENSNWKSQYNFNRKTLKKHFCKTMLSSRLISKSNFKPCQESATQLVLINKLSEFVSWEILRLNVRLSNPHHAGQAVIHGINKLLHLWLLINAIVYPGTVIAVCQWMNGENSTAT